MRRPSRTTALVAVIFWIVVGPLAAVFGACAAMGAMCEGPCGVGPGAILLVMVAPILLALRLAVPVGHLAPAVVFSLIDPPPRPVLSF